MSISYSYKVLMWNMWICCFYFFVIFVKLCLLFLWIQVTLSILHILLVYIITAKVIRKLKIWACISYKYTNIMLQDCSSTRFFFVQVNFKDVWKNITFSLWCQIFSVLRLKNRENILHLKNRQNWDWFIHLNYLQN